MMGFAYEDNRHNCERHDGFTLLDALLRIVKCDVGCDYACLLLLE